jgi:hypothetical protein
MINNHFNAACVLVAAWICFLPSMNPDAASDKTLFDFATGTNAPVWQILNDHVMGGVSTSSFNVNNALAAFRGEVSLENNGGFGEKAGRC